MGGDTGLCKDIYEKFGLIMDKLKRLLDAVDKMSEQSPDRSQADYDCWVELLEARKAFGTDRKSVV